MPAKSKKQRKFMAAVANNPAFAKKVGVPQSVGEEFMKTKKYQQGRMVGMSDPRGEMMMGGKRAMPAPKKPMMEPEEAAPRQMMAGNARRRRAADAVMGTGAGAPRRMMKQGGMAKSGYKSGGKVRGCGMARGGAVRQCKMVKMKGS
jgi:hypothetical protein